MPSNKESPLIHTVPGVMGYNNHGNLQSSFLHREFLKPLFKYFSVERTASHKWKDRYLRNQCLGNTLQYMPLNLLKKLTK